MKNFFSIIGVFSLAIVSFIYTNKTVELAKKFDNVMTTIREVSDDYYVSAVDGIFVDENHFIPGVSGRVVDEKKSYKNMRSFGSFNKNLLVFDEVMPNNDIYSNMDKYIVSGNKVRRAVSLVFRVNNYSDVKSIVNILDDKKIKASFFIDNDWFENNKFLINYFKENNYNVGINSEDINDFFDVDFSIKKIFNRKFGYCYVENDNFEILNKCFLNNNFTIKPNIIVINNPLLSIRDNVVSGSIISLPCSKRVILELPSIINFLNSKGFSIVNLDELLLE